MKNLYFYLLFFVFGTAQLSAVDRLTCVSIDSHNPTTKESFDHCVCCCIPCEAEPGFRDDNPSCDCAGSVQVNCVESSNVSYICIGCLAWAAHCCLDCLLASKIVHQSLVCLNCLACTLCTTKISLGILACKGCAYCCCTPTSPQSPHMR